MTGSKTRRYNPERSDFRGRSYRKGSRRIADLRDRSRLSSDKSAY